jgi:Ca-activated chloride channel family protein
VATGITLGSPIDAAHGVDPNAKYQTVPMPPVEVIRTVQDAWNQLKRALNVTLLIDVSGSMEQGGKIEGARSGASAFVNRLGDDDTLSLYSFSTQSRLLVSQVRIGDSRTRILNTIAGFHPDAETSLYDTIALARQNLKIDTQRINAIVVLTDGQDTSSRKYKLGDLLAALGKAKGAVTIYTIGYGGDADKSVLTQIADAGNGSYFAGDPTTIDQVYLEIASQFGGSRGLGR